MISNSGPYEAFAFDSLHTVWAGLADHLSTQLKLHVEKSGPRSRDLAVRINAQYVFSRSHPPCLTYSPRVDAIPRWRDLHHFENFMELNFNDGSKHEDACKVRRQRSSTFVSSLTMN